MSTREQLFGTDLGLTILTPRIDLQPDGSGDLAMVSGNDNILQALVLRLIVQRGELAALGWPSYGSRLHELIGEPNIPRTHVKLMAFARDALEQDPRVRQISAVRAQIPPGERDTVRLQIEVLLIDQPNPLNLVYDMNLGAV